MNNHNLLVDAKVEYTKQLQTILVPRIFEGIESIYIDACDASNTSKTYLKNFQDLLSDVPKWNQDIINMETKRILKISNCDFLDKLISLVILKS